MYDICIYGNGVLRRKAEPVEQFDENLKRFADEMLDTMVEKDGVGLAAPQVGKSVRVAVIDTSGGEEEPYVLVNPEITWMSEETEDYEEGCLSIPEIRLNVKRPARCSVRALDASGNEYRIEQADGLLARALQHEIDHLDGILFVDRVSPLQRQLVASKLKKMAKNGRGTACNA
ncbi:MAG: peptide deformylase [Chitinivibrionales bacterium]|nr:peptide deformylase [Chitinivibrionales bacterium]